MEAAKCRCHQEQIYMRSIAILTGAVPGVHLSECFEFKDICVLEVTIPRPFWRSSSVVCANVVMMSSSLRWPQPEMTFRLTIARFCPPAWSLRQQLISSHLLTSPNNDPQSSHFLWIICLWHSSLFHSVMNRLESSSGPLKLLWAAEQSSVATNTRTSAPLVPFVFGLLAPWWWREELPLSAASNLRNVTVIKGRRQEWERGPYLLLAGWAGERGRHAKGSSNGADSFLNHLCCSLGLSFVPADVFPRAAPADKIWQA